LDDLRRVGLRERSAEDREILREPVGDTPVHAAVARHHAVAGNDLFPHPEIAAAVGDELVDFLERAGIEEQVHPLAGGQLTARALLAKTLFSAAELGPAIEVGQYVLRVHLVLAHGSRLMGLEPCARRALSPSRSSLESTIGIHREFREIKEKTWLPDLADLPVH